MNSKKPWTSYQEQLDILKKRDLKVNDEAKALHYLERIGYYRLSGYWYPFRKNELGDSSKKQDCFRAQSYFEDAVKLYVFDKRLRLLALDAIERIELALRVDVSHLLGEHDVCGHENPALFHGKFSKHVDKKKRMTLHQQWLKNFDRQISRAKNEPFIIHYKNKHQGQLPIWVACEVWDFGGLSHIFAGLKLVDQQIIANKYGEQAAKSDNRNTALQQWMRSLNFIRNVSAHHSRLWNVNILERSDLPSNSHWQALDNQKPFFYFCMMQELLKTICPNSSWGKRLIELLEDFPTPRNQSTSLQAFGINDLQKIKQWDLWQ